MTPLTPRAVIAAAAGLAFAHALVGQFVAQGVPLFLRAAGASPALVGLVFLASVPYVLRFLWAPLVDRHAPTRFGRRRAWIVGAQAAIVALLLLLAFADPGTAPVLVVAAVPPLMIAVSTAGTALGGLMVEHLPEAARPRAAAFQAAASGLAGLLLGLGVLYLLADLGWRAVVATILTLSLVALIALLLAPLDAGIPRRGAPARFLDGFAVLRRAEPRRIIGVTVAVGAGVVVPYGLKAVLLIDAGWSVGQAALVGIVLGSGVGLLAVLAIRPLVERHGGYACLGGIGALAASLAALFALLGADGLDRTEAAAFVVAANALVYSAFPAGRSLLMGGAAPGREATELAALISFEGVAVLLIAAAANWGFGRLGLPPVLLAAGCVSLLGAVLAFRAARTRRVPLPRERTT